MRNTRPAWSEVAMTNTAKTFAVGRQGRVIDREARVGAEVPPIGRQRAVMHEGHARFAAYMAHELRTPLATQCALLELALAEPETDVAAWRVIGEDILAGSR